MTEMKKIDFTQWQAMQTANDLVIDVRTPAEFGGGHIVGSVNLPLQDCTPEALASLLAGRNCSGGKVCLVCQAGRRSEMAAQQLTGWQGADVWLLEGGVNAVTEPLNVTAARKVIPLERQVLIGAGSLVLLGVLLGALVAPGFYFISGFVGAGLVFAGLTGFCGMALLLARMPWNRS